MIVKFKKLDNFLSAPVRNYETDAGADVFATKDFILYAHSRYAMPLGFSLEVPKGYMGIIVTKSSTFLKGIISHIPPVDSGYTGECHALLENSTEGVVEIKKGDKVAQLIIVPIVTPVFEETEEIKSTERGVGGFGSTGGTYELGNL